ncbi:phage terminase small subunit P27 family [Luteolibacter rhizosphaerae]|nr:phage terminase small subunit P27 family [Luteolibacter rhizosphaerae]
MLALTGLLAPLCTEPPDLKGGIDAELEYERIAKELAKLGHLTDLNRQCLINYCEAWELAQVALKELADDGVTLVNAESGNRYMHPAMTVWSMARATMEKEAKNLGMTPASLQSIKNVKIPSSAKKQEDGPSAFLT